ncbi:unnamed protein product [Gongylonema pulchrum]|uniref:MFS domain-containing protein n=1 Tax=Gongylonema pulchrum TaxID=637853 RepID=A0A183E0J1_9BILA|nr:unnamed protein product [Gongylonema pulchrum]
MNILILNLSKVDLRCDQIVLTVVFLTLGIGLSGAAYAGYAVSYLDIAPTFAGQLMGIGNTLSCIAGILGPIIVGVLTPQATEEEWRRVFFITGGILVVGLILYCVFATSDVQPWAKTEKIDESSKKTNQKADDGGTVKEDNATTTTENKKNGDVATGFADSEPSSVTPDS